MRGQLRLPDLAAHVKLSIGVLEALLTFMRSERLCEMVRHGETDGTWRTPSPIWAARGRRTFWSAASTPGRRP